MKPDSARAFMPYPKSDVPHADTGPLLGLSFAVKDLFDVAGYPTSGGQPFLLAMSGIKTSTAPAVQALLDAGAKFAGKTVTDELAFSLNGQNAHFGSPINAAAPNRIAGGSSSGSVAAVAHGLVDVALGTDTGGSIRAPASHCGVVGLRPSHGRISLQGTLELAPSLDTCGWFSRNIDVFHRVAEVLLGTDARTFLDAPRLIKPVEVWALLSPEVHESFAPGLARVEKRLGAVQTLSILGGTRFEDLYWAFRFIQGHEAWMVDGPLIEGFNPPLGTGVAQRFAWSRTVTRDQWIEALALRARYTEFLTELLGDNGLLILPSMPDVAPLIDAEESSLEDYRVKAQQMLCLSGLCGLPQISLPLASRLGAPLGLSLMGPRGSDMKLVSVARSLMQKTDGGSQ